MARILILHPERSARKTLKRHTAAHHEVQCVADVRGALKHLSRSKPQLVLAGMNGKRTDAFDFLRQMQQSKSRLPTILVASGGAGAFGSMAMKMGAKDVLEYPVEEDALNQAISKVLTSEWSDKGKQPEITEEERSANLTELEDSLNRRMQCFAGKNQVYLQSFILGGGQVSKPRIALKCPLRKEYGEPPNVYYEYIRDVCCSNPSACTAHQTFRAKHPDV